ncbi:TPR-like protein [Gymnopus androsaceus JB14]|uniref:TPR-like protein n=1 Tax=Gymnopus androsaceus JB14 TaxID=1447944 RepID=A0A6A4ISU4_9AGAR|nr:TPR-like protein [Gymnopus androsaceus JB14]
MTTSEMGQLHLIIEEIKLHFSNPQRQKIYVTLSNNEDHSVLVKTETCILEGEEMIWKLTQPHIVVDTSSAILIKVKGYNLTRQNETFSTFVLQSNEIFDKLVESNTNGEDVSAQDFVLSDSDATLILTMYSKSLNSFLKEYVPTQGTLRRLGLERYEKGLDLIMGMLDQLGSSNSTVKVVIGGAKAIYEILKTQDKCHHSILELFEQMADMLSFIQDAGPLKTHSKQVEHIMTSIIKLIDSAVVEVLEKCRGNMLEQFISATSLSEKVEHYTKKFTDLKQQYGLVLIQVTALLVLSSDEKPSLSSSGMDQKVELIDEKLSSNHNEIYGDEKVAVDVPTGYIQGMSNYPSSTLFFTGRESIMNFMAKYFSETPPPQARIGAKIFLLYGLGGAGKTQCALEFIQRYKQRFTRIFFIAAHSEDSIKAGYYDIAVRNGSKTPQSWESGYRWLITHKEEWLILLDNVDDPKINASQFLPSCDHGNVVITSRNFGLVNLAGKTQEIKDMEPGDGTQLLLKHAIKHEPTSDETLKAAEIAEELHYFPLALKQAGAYIFQQNCLSSYLQRIQNKQEKLLQKNISQSLDNYPFSVHSSWNLSWKELTDASKTFLKICSCLHNEFIPRQLFQDAVQRINNISEEFGPSDAILKATYLLQIFCTENMDWDEIKMDDIIFQVTSYSLLNIVQDGLYSLHPMVHRWIKDNMSVTDRDNLHWGTQGILAASIFSATEGDIVYLRSLTPHLTAFEKIPTGETSLKIAYGNFWYQTGHAEKALQLWEPLEEELAEILGSNHPTVLRHTRDLAMLYQKLAQYKNAVELQEKLIITSKQVMGEEHPDTIQCKNNLAVTYQHLGKYNNALQLQEPLIQTSRQILGTKHPDTLRLTNDLVSTYMMLGKNKEGFQLLEALLESSKSIMGEEHPDTLLYTNHLAISYCKMGKNKEALELQQHLLTKAKRLLGEEHPSTIAWTHDLALTYNHLRNYSEALTIWQSLVKTSVQMHGDEHPNTLMRINRLAFAYSEMSNHSEALRLRNTLVETSKRVLGQEHPDTLAWINNLAMTYSRLSKHGEALSLWDPLVVTSKNVLGEDHPDTLTRINNLAATYYNMGSYTEALSLWGPLVDVCKQVLGEYHPNTLMRINCLAMAYHNLGQDGEALSLREPLVKASKNVLGEEHPDTLMRIHNLSMTYQILGQKSEALSLMNYLVETSNRVLGEGHPDTLMRMDNLAMAYHNLGQDGEALRMREYLVETSSHVLGEAHLDTLARINNLAMTYSQMSKHGEALSLRFPLVQTSKSVLGDEHPDTLARINNLAITYYHLESFSEALSLWEPLIEICKWKLGEEHPDTLARINSLALTYYSMESYYEALSLWEPLIEKTKWVLGKEHPDTLKRTNMLAMSYYKLGEDNQALKIWVPLVKMANRVFGKKHPETLKCRIYLGIVYKSLNNYDLARITFHTLLPILKEVHGNNHPHTLSCMQFLDEVNTQRPNEVLETHVVPGYLDVQPKKNAFQGVLGAVRGVTKKLGSKASK